MSNKVELKFEYYKGENMPWPNSVIMIGENSCALFDCQFMKSDGQNVAKLIKDTGKPLTDIYVSHSDPDHVWGAAEIIKTFPNAKLWARKEVALEIELQWRARHLRWKELLGNKITDSMPKFNWLEGSVITVDGHKLQVIDNLGCETIYSTSLYHAESKTLLAGDLIYHDCHLYITGCLNHPESWAARLREIRDAYDIERIFPGHGTVGGIERLEFSLEYLETYMSVYHPKITMLELGEEMERRYPELTLQGVLYMSIGPGITSPSVLNKKGQNVPFGSRSTREAP